MKRQWHTKIMLIIAVLMANAVYADKKPHAFFSQTALKETFDVLCNEEQELQKTGELGTSSIAATNFNKKLIFFYQRVFRTIVAEDTKNGLTYTKELNIQIKKDGHIVARKLPLTRPDAVEQCLYLTRLVLNPNDQIALTALKNLHAKKIQKKPTDAFFPTIVVIEDNSNILDVQNCASYVHGSNTIYIRKQVFSLGEFDTIIHEFTHAKQLWYGSAMGGFCLRPLNKSRTIPTAAIEIEAEKESVRRHPKPLLILENLEKIWAIGNSAQVMFPYFTIPETYAFVLKHFGLTGNEPYTKEAQKAYELRKKDLNPLINKYVTIRNRQKIRTTKWRDYEGILDVISAPNKDNTRIKCKNMLANIRAYYPNATLADIHVRGCKQYLDIKKKLGLIPS